MARHTHVETLTILNGTQVVELKGNQAKKVFGQATSITIFAPATLPETVTVLIAGVKAPASTDYTNVGASAVTIAAGMSYTLPTTAFAALKLSAGAAVGADRVFKLVAQLDTTREWG